MAETEWRTRLRTLVLHPSAPRLLLAGGSPGVPETELPAKLGHGDTAAVVAAMRESLGLDLAVLRVVSDREVPEERRHDVLLLCALRGPQPAGTCWVGFDGLPDPDVRALAGPLLDEATDPLARPRQPWTGRDWLPAVESWLRSALPAAGRTLTGPIEQRKVWELSCVQRAPTESNRQDLWMKIFRRLLVGGGRRVVR